MEVKLEILRLKTGEVIKADLSSYQARAAPKQRNRLWRPQDSWLK